MEPSTLDSPLLTRDEAAMYCRVGLRTFDRRVAPYVRTVPIGSSPLVSTEGISIDGSKRRRMDTSPRSENANLHGPVPGCREALSSIHWRDRSRSGSRRGCSNRPRDDAWARDRDRSAPAPDVSSARALREAGWRRWVPKCRQRHGSRCWETYAAAHFIPFFETAQDLCSDARLGDYMRCRLTKVKRTTLKKELSALNRLFDWMVEQKLLGAKPTIPRISKRATGTPHPAGKARNGDAHTRTKWTPSSPNFPCARSCGYPMRAYYEAHAGDWASAIHASPAEGRLTTTNQCAPST